MRVIVIGAGAVGLSAALISNIAGHDVILIDPKGFDYPNPEGEINTQVWALGPSARSLLTSLGVSFDSERICSYNRMRVIDSCSDARVEFFADQLGDMVEANWICSQLMEKVASSSIECRVDPINAVSQGGMVDDPISILTDCDLAIFCEGRIGKTAKKSGFEKRDQGFHQYAIVGTLGCEKPHNGVAFQIFTAQGPLALLPLPDDGSLHRVSLVWTVTRTEYSRLCRLSDTELLQIIETVSELERGTLVWRSELVWVPVSQHDLKHDSLGVCLAIGDTAHGILPLAGLGANLGFKDVRALADTLDHQNLDGIRVARTVARLRRSNNWVVMQMMSIISASFESMTPLVRLVRSLAFRTVDRYTFISRLIQGLAG